MSLYDMYFSKRNKNHMFNVLSQLILKETSFDIKNDKNYIDLYRNYYPIIFENINTDELTILNAELINVVGEIIIQKLKNPQSKKYQIKNTIQNKEILNDNNLVEPISKKYKEIYSIQRNKDSLNRFNFNIKVDYDKFIPKNVTILKEQNSLFSNDTIFLRFNDTDNLSFQYKGSKQIGNNEYYTYECETEDTIKCDQIVNIQILNYLLISPCKKRDIFKIRNNKDITYEKNKYTCLEIKDNNFSVDQEIGLLNKENDIWNYSLVNPTAPGSWVTFGEDINKELYIASVNGGLYKIVSAALNTNDLDERNISIYPNPFENEIYFNNLAVTVNIIIYDINGKELLTFENHKDNVLHLDILDSGIYFININNQIKKIIKK